MGLNVREGEIMAKNRSRRLRKKMHIEEFQEVGFSVAWRFPEGTSVEQIDPGCKSDLPTPDSRYRRRPACLARSPR